MELHRDVMANSSRVRDALAEIVRLNGEVTELRNAQSTTQYVVQKYSSASAELVLEYRGLQTGPHQIQVA